MQNNSPLITIITVSYNSEKTIKETIESVLSQTYNNFEYLIIDGLSSDKTIEIAKSYDLKFADRNIKYTIVSEKDKGIYDAMNKGVALAAGDIIGIINSDDYYNLDALEKVVNFYNKGNWDVMYGDLRVFKENKEFIKKSKETKKFSTRYWNHPTTFVTKKVYNNQKYACKSIYDDLNFMLETRNNGYKISIFNEVLANFRLGGVSNERSWKLVKKRIKLRNEIYKENGQKHYKFNNWLIETAKYFLS